MVTARAYSSAAAGLPVMAEESDAALPIAPSLRQENHPRNVSHARSRLDTTAIKVNRAADDVVRVEDESARTFSSSSSPPRAYPYGSESCYLPPRTIPRVTRASVVILERAAARSPSILCAPFIALSRALSSRAANEPRARAHARRHHRSHRSTRARRSHRTHPRAFVEPHPRRSPS